MTTPAQDCGVDPFDRRSGAGDVRRRSASVRRAPVAVSSSRRGGPGGGDRGPVGLSLQMIMDHKRISAWSALAAVLYLGAVAVALVAVLLTAGLVREYGPAEGYGNLIQQTLPIVAAGLLLAALLTWAGVRTQRRRHR